MTSIPFRPGRVCACLLAIAAASAADPPAKTAVTATSFQPNQGNEAEMALDAQASTFWHSAWNPMAALPQALTIDYGAPRTVASLVYQPRPGGGNGTATAFQVAVSLDGQAFTTVVADGSWPADASRKFVNFAPAQARFVRFTVTAGVGGFASAAEVFCMPTKLDAAPPDPGRIAVVSPAYAAEIQGRTAIAIRAPGLDSATVTCWKQGDGFGSDATVGTIALDAEGRGSIDFPADEFPHGPICLTIAGSGGNLKDNCHLQLFNRGGVKWKLGLPAAPAAAAGMTQLFADDFDGPLSISSTDPAARYYDHKPPNGSQDFSHHRFTGFADPGNPFHQVGTWLRIRADDARNSAGLISSLRNDGSGFTARAPCYFECRFIGPNATGTWPAFWLLSDYMKQYQTTKKLDIPCDEIDIIEAYGGEGPKSPNAFDKYCVTPHAWNQDQARKQAAMKQIRAGKGSAAFDWAPQVVAMRNIGIPSTWYQTAHTYAVKITESDTIYYCDEIEIARHDTLAVSKTEPFFFLINLATGGGWPVDLSRYGGIADMYVDWVRVYGSHPDDLARLQAPKR